MENKDLNRIKVMLAEKKKTSKWLAEQLGKNPATISRWCTNVSQPSWLAEQADRRKRREEWQAEIRKRKGRALEFEVNNYH